MTMDRRKLLAELLTVAGVASVGVFGAPGARAMPVGKPSAPPADVDVRKARVVVVAPPRRRRWVCWWRHGRRVCGWRWV